MAIVETSSGSLRRVAPPLQLMLDGNIADVLLEDEILRNGLRDLLNIGAAETYVTHVVIDEIFNYDRLVRNGLRAGLITPDDIEDQP
jgi:hypothetical protein